MSRLSENRHWLLFAAVVLTTLGAAGVFVVGLLATLATLLTGGTLLGTLAAWVLGTLLLAGLDAVLLAALLSELARRASLPRSQRAADLCRRVESLVPPLAALGLADRLAPTVADRREALTERYVDGDLSEAELEAELRELLAEDGEAGSASAHGVAEATGELVRERDAETET